MSCWICDEESDLQFEGPKKLSTKFKSMRSLRSNSGTKNKTTKTPKLPNGIRATLNPGLNQVARVPPQHTPGRIVDQKIISTLTLNPFRNGIISCHSISIAQDSHQRSFKRKTSAEQNVNTVQDSTTAKHNASHAC